MDSIRTKFRKEVDLNKGFRKSMRRSKIERYISIAWLLKCPQNKPMRKIKSVIFILLSVMLVSFCPLGAQAQGRRVPVQPTFTYDLGASTGTYNSTSYSEINLGLNWFLARHLVWRNSLFTRFGSKIDGSSGLDTSARAVFNTTASEDLVLGLFAGPGYRILNPENSGVFAEAGLMLKAFGLGVGVGMKSLTYNSPGKNANGTERGKTDTTIFLILAGGGGF